MEKEIIELKEKIINGHNPDKQKLVDRLIVLEGIKAMDFFQSIFLIDPYQQNKGSAELNNIAGYGVRQLIKLRATQSKSEFKFCPYCKLDLNEYELIDPYMIGFACKNHHRFHIEIIRDGQFTDKSLQSDKTSPLEIAKDWLTDKNLRKQVQNQLAEILRKYIDIQTSISNEEEKNQSFMYCPICTFDLKEFEQDDVWVVGLKCSNNHILYSRNGLSYDGAWLKTDISKDTFSFLIKSYLEEARSEHLPEQIAKLLTEINN